MKITTILLFSACLTASAGGLAQNVTLSAENVKIEKIFKEIKKQTDYVFFYDARVLQGVRTVSIHVKNQSVEEVLKKILKGKPLDFSIERKTITIVQKAGYSDKRSQSDFAASVVAIPLLVPVSIINGTVKDAQGNPLVGVSVLVKGTTKGTSTGADGSFSIDANVGDVLEFTMVGYQKKSVAVGQSTNLNVVMEIEVSVADEVVIVGYGTQKKENLTGAIDQVSSKVLENRPVVSASEALQGLIPNLNVINSNGEPGTGSNSNFNIRGFTSINGGSPLVLVDGAEMDINLINMADIKSITVLKDAGSAAIYGSRAAFGVILIQTKSGIEGGKTKVTYSANFSFRRPTILPDIVGNSYDQAVAINEALFNYEGTFQYGDQYLAMLKAYHEDPKNNPEWAVVNGVFQYYGFSDWEKELLRSFAPTQQHSLGLSGGSGKTSFYASLGFLDQRGLYRHGTDSYKKLNASLSVNNQTFSWLKTNVKIGYDNTALDAPHGYTQSQPIGYINSLLFSSSTKPIRYPGNDPNYLGRYFNSPASYQKLTGRDVSKVNHVLLSTGLTASVNKYFQIIGNFTYNIYRNAKNNYAKKIPFLANDFTTEYGETNNDNLYLETFNSNYYSLSGYAQYERTFEKNIYGKAMVGFDQELNDVNSYFARRYNLVNPQLPAINLATGTQEVGGGITQWALRGAFYRFNFALKDRYLIELNGRYDGSSRFPQNSRYGFFPSFSAGWRLSKESFMAYLKPIVSNMKLRGSYGTLGNQSISYRGTQQYYPYIPSMSSSANQKFLFNNVTDLLINPPGLVSPSLAWEKATTLNLGTDVGFLNNRLEASFDWYRRTTSDMLINVMYPQVLGAVSPAQNAAELQTKGWELSLKWHSYTSNKFNYSLRVVLSDNHAEITKYNNPSGSLNDYYVGQKLGEIWGYQTTGIFQSQSDIDKAPDQSQIAASWKPGDISYADLNGDGKINSGDRTLTNHGDLKVIGNTTPRYSLGISSDMTYGAFFANIFFQGVGKRDYWPGFDGFWPFASQWFQVQKQFVTDSWSEENTGAYFSRPLARDTKNRLPQSRYLQNASYIRLKTLTIGYNMPSTLVNRIRMEKIQIYTSGYNLLEYTKMRKPLDPELNLGAANNLGYPYQRAYSLGLNITF